MFHEQVLPVLMREFLSTGKAYLVFRDYVLPPIAGHEHSGEAARYAVAANRVGKYQEVADALFLNQPNWTRTGDIWPVVAAVLTPAEQKKVQALYKDPDVAAEVTHDTETGKRAGLARTPTVAVNYKGQHHMWDQWSGDNALFFSYLRDLLKK